MGIFGVKRGVPNSFCIFHDSIARNFLLVSQKLAEKIPGITCFG